MNVFLGIHVGHNASAAIMINGKIKYALQEERFNNIKNFTGFPENSLNFIYNYINKINLNIDIAGFSTTARHTFELKYPLHHHFSIKEFDEYYGEKFYSKKLKGKNVSDYINFLKNDIRFKKKNIYSSINDNFLFEKKKNYQKISKEKLKNIFKEKIKKIIFLDHHTCHAYYGKFSIDNKEKNYAVVVIDSIGDGINQSIWLPKNKSSLKSVVRNSQCDLGRIYKFITLILNMKPDEHEFKVMGMAPYAKEKYFNQIYNNVFKDILKFKNLKIVHNKRPKDLYLFLKNKLKYERFDNIAGAVQFYVENTINKLIFKIYKKYKIKKIFFSGGVSMNIKMYNKFMKNNFLTKIYNAPSGSDESLSIGACYYLNRDNKSFPLESLSIGLPLFSNTELANDVIRKEFKKRNYSVRYNVKPTKIAKLIKNNNIIAIANGNEEFGARALGNRSIIANPSDINNIKKINEFIKNRDFWMPFALSINDASANKYLFNSKKLESYYMNLSFDTKKKYYDKIKAGCHPYDRSVRPQFVKKIHNESLYEIIKEFNKITGINALLNTSLNLHGFPKSSYLKYVIKTFKKSGLKYLYLNGSILIKKN